jgi:hypothetical protein
MTIFTMIPIFNNIPDKRQRAPLKPPMQQYAQLPSGGSHMLQTHVSQRCS